MAQLVGCGAEIAEGGVAAAGIVEAFDALENGAPGRSSCGPWVAVDQVWLEGREETLGDGVVPAIVGPAEAGSDAASIQDLGVALGGVLATTVGVMDQLGCYS